MEPASATVAFVGFAASIATLLAIAVDSFRTIHDVYISVKNAPHEIQRLDKKFMRLHKMILEVQHISQDFQNGQPPAFIVDFWLQHAAEIGEDFLEFKRKTYKLRAELSGKSVTGKNMTVRVKNFFSERDMRKCEEQLSEHIQTVGILMNMLSHAQSRLILSELQIHTKQLQEFIPATDTQNVNTKQEDNVSQPTLPQLVSKGLQQLCAQTNSGEARTVLEFLYHASQDTKSLRLDCNQREIPIDIALPSEISHSGIESCGLRQPTIEIDQPRQLVYPFLKTRLTSGSSAFLKTVSWRLSIYRFPIGILTVERSSKQEEGNSTGYQEYYVYFALYPPAWIANRAIKFSLSLGGGSGAPAYTLESEVYNSDPRLLQAISSGNIEELKVLFFKRMARPTDIIAPWGNTLLHEAILNQSCGQDSLELVQFLLEHGANPNIRSGVGSTPLLLSCDFMSTSYGMDNEFQSITTALIKNGGDLTICNPAGYSSCSLIFDSKPGVQYLEEFVCPYIDLFTFEEMDSMDAWLLAALARSYPSFQIALESQLREWRTPKEISSSQLPIEDKLTKLDIPHQIEQLKRATTHMRTTFIRVICKRGNTAMLAPFLDCDIDLDERWADNGPYLIEATYAGNLDVTMALLEAGASIQGQTISNPSRNYGHVTSPVIALISRWVTNGGKSVRMDLRDRDLKSESWILQELLQHPTFYDGDALLVAIQQHSSEWILRALLDAGCGRQGDGPPVSWRQRFNGSEIITAVKHENLHLKLLINHGLGLEFEDRLGFTALLHAIDLRSGPIDYAKMLIDAGANVVKRTSSGYTPLELARENLKGPHPRIFSRKWHTESDDDGIMSKQVSLEQDQQIYEYLARVVRERRVGYVLETANWVLATVNSIPSWYEDLRDAHSRLKEDNSILDLFLAGLGLVITTVSLLIITMWQLIWRTGWNIFVVRKSSSIERISIFAVLLLGWALKQYCNS